MSHTTPEAMAEETWPTKLAGVFVLLAMAAEIASYAVAVSQGAASGGPPDFGDAETLRVFAGPMPKLALSLALLPAVFATFAWPGMYPLLKRGGAAGLYGIIVASVGMAVGMVGECVRLALVLALPSTFAAAADTTKPAILALGRVLFEFFTLIDEFSFVILFSVGVPLIAVAIVRSGQLSRWWGFSVLPVSLLVGCIGAPLVLLDQPIGRPIVFVFINLFFIWFIAFGIKLLRWQPRVE
jgi:hypothetical protein